jgi:ribosomal protein S18 acetylase RimI-like enzyme
MNTKKELFSIRAMKIEDIEKVIGLYSQYMEESTFSLLGKKFLNDIFQVIITLDYCCNYVCEVDSTVIAFISGTENSKLLFREVLRRKMLSLLCQILILGFKSPLKVMGLLKTPFYFSKTGIDSISAEMLYITVLPEFAEKGIARHLISAVLSCFTEKGIKKVKVSVVKSNYKINNLLLKIGFKKYSYFKFYGYERVLYFKNL